MFFGDFLSDLRFDFINLGISTCLILIIIPALIYSNYKKNKTPRIRFSSIKNIKHTKKSLKVRLRNLPLWLRILAVTLLLVSFTHPYLEREVKREGVDLGEHEKKEEKKEERKKIKVPTEGISIQLLIDRSGSMGTHNNGLVNFNFTKFENNLLSKLDVVKIVSKRFIMGTKETSRKDSVFSGRGNDMIGLFTFARYPFIACPLTLRHELLLDYISQLETVRLREEDGTYIGYALERAILQIIDAKSRAEKEDAYNIKSSIIILITDGEQSIRPEDSNDRHKALLPSEAANLAKDNKVKIYSIAISPHLIHDERGTVIGNSRNFSVDEIQKAAEITGGKFYHARDGDALYNIYTEIDKLEKSKIPSKKELEVRVEKTKEIKKKETEKIELFQLFLWPGFIILIIEIFLSTIYFRRIP